MTKGVDVDSSLVFVDLTILFMHLIVLVERSGYNTKYFGFGLAPYPTALFNRDSDSLEQSFQFVIFKPLNYCFKETIGFDVKASFASRP